MSRVLICLVLSGCSASFQLGRQAIVAQPGAATVIEPNGEVIEEIPARASAIDTVITGMSQAQQVRTLTRQLAR